MCCAAKVVREASARVLGLRPFDVQLMGGMILHEGQIAEMRTGEVLGLHSVYLGLTALHELGVCWVLALHARKMSYKSM